MNKFPVQNLLKNYSIEATVQQAQRIRRFADIVQAGTRIYIPHTPHSSFTEMADLAERIRTEGMEPVPHIVARRIENFASLESVLKRLSTQAGVTQVLAVAGDISKPAGEPQSALEILESGLLEKYGIRTIGVAGHPEGHPQVADPALRDALRRKAEYAAKTGAAVYVVTQFVFSADPVIRWEASHGSDIGPLTVVAGLPGLASVKTLFKYAMECGIGASLQAFMKRSASLSKLVTVSAPDETIVRLAAYKERTPQSRLSGLHFFTFGGFEKTAEWANRIAAGDFEFTEDGGLKTGTVH
jgi:methylenetetrahydrofolate reductase (NADPH)